MNDVASYLLSGAVAMDAASPKTPTCVSRSSRLAMVIMSLTIMAFALTVESRSSKLEKPRTGGILGDIFAFDYMGAAEFEFGAVPQALQRIAQNQGELTAFSFTIPLSEVAPDWRDKDSDPPEGEGTIYVLCPQEWASEVESRIRGWAGEPYSSNLKETTRLSNTLRPYSEWDGDIQGWLELDNGFMFFTDEEMWSQTCALFGVETGVEK